MTMLRTGGTTVCLTHRPFKTSQQTKKCAQKAEVASLDYCIQGFPPRLD